MVWGWGSVEFCFNWQPSGHKHAPIGTLTHLWTLWKSVVVLDVCVGCDLLVDDVHLEDSCSVV